MFSERIQEAIAAGQTSAKATQEAFTKFVKEYEERWRARTVCAAGHVTVRCSNGRRPKRSNASLSSGSVTDLLAQTAAAFFLFAARPLVERPFPLELIFASR
jgi:hypothetical protein